MTADRVKLLHGPYGPPPLRKGDRAFCLYRDAEAVVTAWSDGRIMWPRCRALDNRGGSGLLVTEELRRAILSESAAALMYWFGVGVKAVWRWRRAFGVEQFGTDGSRRLHQAASDRGAAKLRGRPAPPRAKPRRTDLHQLLELARTKRWEGQEWTAEQRALLGTLPDDMVAAKTGRTVQAVRLKRSKLGIPKYRAVRSGEA